MIDEIYYVILSTASPSGSTSSPPEFSLFEILVLIDFGSFGLNFLAGFLLLEEEAGGAITSCSSRASSNTCERWGEEEPSMSGSNCSN